MPPSVISFYLCARNESVDRVVLLATTGKNAKNILFLIVSLAGQAVYPFLFLFSFYILIINSSK